MSTILFAQVQWYKEQAESTCRPDEKWHEAHEQAMVCRDLEDLMDLGTRIFAFATESIRRARPSDIKQAREMENLYRVLGVSFELVEQCIAAVRGWGYEPEGVSVFQSAHTELRSILSLSVDRAAKSLQQLDAGRARPFGEVMDELCRQRSAGSHRRSL